MPYWCCSKVHLHTPETSVDQVPHETHAQLHVHARVYSPCTYRAPARVHTPVRTHRRVRRSTPRRSSVPIQQGSFRHRADRALIVGRSGTRSTRFFIICCTNFFSPRPAQYYLRSSQGTSGEHFRVRVAKHPSAASSQYSYLRQDNAYPT